MRTPTPKRASVAKANSIRKRKKRISDAIMFDVIDSMIPSLARKFREEQRNALAAERNSG